MSLGSTSALRWSSRARQPVGGTTLRVSCLAHLPVQAGLPRAAWQLHDFGGVWVAVAVFAVFAMLVMLLTPHVGDSVGDGNAAVDDGIVSDQVARVKTNR